MSLQISRSLPAGKSSLKARQEASTSSHSSLLWHEKYKPKDAKEVAAHHSKKTQIRSWILKIRENQQLYRRRQSHSSGGYKPSVLVLCGSSGCCKSTMVEIIAKELSVPLVEWNEDMLESHSRVAFNAFLNSQEYAESFNVSGGTARDEMVDELNDFAIRSAYASLRIQTVPKRLAKIVEPSPPTVMPSFSEVVDLSAEDKKRKKVPLTLMNTKLSKADDIVDFDNESSDDEALFQSSKRRRMIHPYNTFSRSSSMRSTSSGGTVVPDDEVDSRDSSFQVILVHDPMSLINNSSKREGSSNDASIGSQILRFRQPVVLILSDVGGRDDVRWAVEELIPKRIRDSIDLEVIYCTPITVLAVKKNLQKIAEKESGEKARDRRGMMRGNSKLKKELRSLEVPPDCVLEAIATACSGDLRQAILQLQMYMMGRAGVGGGRGSVAVVNGNNGRGASDTSVLVDAEVGSRDKSFSFLHGIAKLLRANLSTPSSCGNNREEPHEIDYDGHHLYKFSFSPDSVIRNLDLPLDLTLNFLQFNYPAVFEQVEQDQTGGSVSIVATCQSLPMPTYDALERMARVADVFSEADMLHACQYSSNLPIDRAESSSFPNEYVESICSRASACSMYPVKKTSSLFASFREGFSSRSGNEALSKSPHLVDHDGDIEVLSRDGGNNKMMDASSTSKRGSSRMIPIRRPASLDVRRRAKAVSSLTKDLRAALVTYSPTAVSRPPPLSSSASQGKVTHSPTYRAVVTRPQMSFDFIVKQSYHESHSMNRQLCDENDPPSDIAEETLPTSFLSSTELITVVVPYIKAFYSMYNQRKQELQVMSQHRSTLSEHSSTHPFLHLPEIQRNIEALMGTLEHTGELSSHGISASVLVGKGRERQVSDNSNSSNRDEEASWNWERGDEVEEFSD